MRNDLLRKTNKDITDKELKRIQDRDVRSLTQMKLNIESKIDNLEECKEVMLSRKDYTIDESFLTAEIDIESLKTQKVQIEDLIKRIK